MATNSPPPTEGVTVVEFRLSDPKYPFVGLSEAEDCRVILEKMLPRGSGAYAEFFSVDGADPDAVLEVARANELVEPKLISRNDDGGLFEFVVEGFCPARALAECRAIPHQVVGEDGSGHIRAELPPDVDSSAVISGFLDDHPDAQLRSKQTKERISPVFTQSELQKAVTDRLTDRQQEVLQIAYEKGYYEASSDITGEELGDILGVTAPTVSQHLRTAERKLIAILLEDSSAENDR
jgi:DNA-binding CsgD family transcriptional regulator